MAKTLEELAEKAKSQLPKKAEPKGAAPAPSAETKKTEDEVKKADELKAKAEKLNAAEEQAKKDEVILSKKEEELDDTEKARKAELGKIKADAEDKEKKSNVQKRIDELTGKIKDLESDRNATKEERDTLKAELDGIKKQLSMTPQDKEKERLKAELEARKVKYLEEDAKLSREERREMPKEELDEWLLEDYEGASEWIAKRTIRRHEEERHLKTEAEQSKIAEAILEKQYKSADKTYAKHPELKVKERQEALLKEGKTREQALEIICKENPKYGLCVQIYNENPQRYMLSENGPELIVAEMEKRMSKSPEANADLEKIRKELAEAKAEVERLKNLDAGITSSRGAEPIKPETEIEKKQVELARKVGLDPERLKKRIATRTAQGFDV